MSILLKGFDLYSECDHRLSILSIHVFWIDMLVIWNISWTLNVTHAFLD